MGYIKLNRKITEWEWYKDPEMLAVWVHLIISAEEQPKEWQGEVIPRGAFVTTMAKLAKDTGVSLGKAQNALHRLSKSGEIVVESTSRYTKIILPNYDLYQNQGAAPVAKPTSTPKPAPKKREKLVFPFTSEAFMNAWNTLVNEPKWRGKTVHAYQLSLNKLGKYEEAFAIELIMTAIERNYQGVVFSNTDSIYQEWLAKHPRENDLFSTAPNGKKYQ